MKKLTAFIMGLVLVFSLAACSGESPSNSSSADSSATQSAQSSTPENSTSSQPESSAPASESAQEPETETGKTLVVYYSATGNTQTAANFIAEATNADVFELEPAEPYTDDDLNWTDENSRVVREHDNPDQRDVALIADTIDGWDSYDTVFIGYPIWWGIAAWPVDGFIEANDLPVKR